MDRFVRKYGRYVPFALTIIIIFCCALFLKDHEFSEILSYCPDNLWLAAFVILGFYGLKSLSVVFPLAAIFVCVGAIYPFWVGILLNVIGLSVCFTVPYLVGRISGGDIMRVIEMKYPKARKLVNYGHDNCSVTLWSFRVCNNIFSFQPLIRFVNSECFLFKIEICRRQSKQLTFSNPCPIKNFKSII